MRKIRLLFVLSILTTISLNAQNIVWQKSLGGSAFDYGKSVEQTSDGGYIIAGYASSNNGDITNPKGSYDYWIVKLNENGSMIWQKSFGGSNQDVANCISETSDGGFIIAGYTISHDGDVSSPISTSGYYKDYWLVKLSSSGSIQWEKSYGGSDQDIANYVTQTSDGGYIVCGNTESNDNGIDNYSAYADGWILRLNSTGGTIWAKNYGGTLDDDLKYITELSNGRIIAVGSSKSNDNDVSSNNGENDAWVLKLTSSGTVDWSNLYGGDKNDVANSAIVLYDGTVIFAGNSESANGGFVQAGNGDYIIGSIGPNGTTNWLKSYGGTAVDNAYSICKKADGNFVIAGSSKSNNGTVQANKGAMDFWLLEINSAGDTIWTQNYGGTLDDVAYNIKQTDDKGFIITGSSNSTNGDITASNGGQDYWVVKLSAFVGINDINNNFSFDIFPNPAKNQISITGVQNIETIDIFDITGKNAKHITTTQFSNYVIDISDLEKGVYFIKLNTLNKVSSTRKLIIE